MVSNASPDLPTPAAVPEGAALQHGHWRKRKDLASGLRHVEHFLGASAFDRGPWLVVGLAAGIAAWFVLPSPAAWIAVISGSILISVLAAATARLNGAFPYLGQSLGTMALMLAAGCGLAWGKSALVGTPPIARPLVQTIDGRVLGREERPAEGRVRLLLAIREPQSGRAVRIRLNVDRGQDTPAASEGALVQVRARLVPPAPPMLPGAYDFARAAWFSGLAATGTALAPLKVLAPGQEGGVIAPLQRRLSAHVRANLDGTPGAIAAAFASGDRGAIAPADEDAMRDAGLTHLLSISGLHVSAVIAAAYVMALRLLALFPWLALRMRLPIVAAAAGALAGIGYTVLTGAEVPTIRSCIGAVLVLLALVLGREPLSLRMVAVAAALVLVFWPEALIGPSFQMSFGAVIAIVALHGAEPVRAWFAPREEPWWAAGLRHMGSLLLTGFVIELALMPIGLFHFHRAGIYGAFANVLAIPLTTLASMPLIALALLADMAGAGAPLWWLAGKSLEALLALAHWTAAMPGAVTTLPTMGRGAFALFLGGGLWLALWTGPVRLWGLVPASLGTFLLAMAQPPDVLVSGDGRHVGIVGDNGDLYLLRESRSDYVRDNLTELSGMNGMLRLFEAWPGARCNRDLCILPVRRGTRDWTLLITRGRDLIERPALIAACRNADIVIADRRLPYWCAPRWIKVDRRSLASSGGLAIDLERQQIDSVAAGQGAHGWWRPAQNRQNRRSAP